MIKLTAAQISRAEHVVYTFSKCPIGEQYAAVMALTIVDPEYVHAPSVREWCKENVAYIAERTLPND